MFIATRCWVVSLDTGVRAIALELLRMTIGDAHAIGTHYAWMMPTLIIDHHGRTRLCSAYQITFAKSTTNTLTLI